MQRGAGHVQQRKVHKVWPPPPVAVLELEHRRVVDAPVEQDAARAPSRASSRRSGPTGPSRATRGRARARPLRSRSGASSSESSKTFRLAINYFARAGEIEIPGPKKREAKQHATIAARTLIELSATTAHGDLELAKQQAALARRLMLRYNVRFGWHAPALLLSRLQAANGPGRQREGEARQGHGPDHLRELRTRQQKILAQP